MGQLHVLIDFDFMAMQSVCMVVVNSQWLHFIYYMYCQTYEKLVCFESINDNGGKKIHTPYSMFW